MGRIAFKRLSIHIARAGKYVGPCLKILIIHNERAGIYVRKEVLDHLEFMSTELGKGSKGSLTPEESHSPFESPRPPL